MTGEKSAHDLWENVCRGTKVSTVADGQRTASVDINITIRSGTGGGGGGGDDINKNSPIREPTRQE